VERTVIALFLSDYDSIMWLSLKMSGEAADETGDRKTDEGSPQEGEQAEAQRRGIATG